MTESRARLEMPEGGERAPLTELFPVKRAWNLTAATGVGSLPGTSPIEAAGHGRGRVARHCRTWSSCPIVGSAPTWSAAPSACWSTSTARWCRPAGGSPVAPAGTPAAPRTSCPGMLDAAQQQYAGAEWVKVQVCGPWTLAAMLEVPSGHRALTDFGAVDDIATSLGRGTCRAHRRDRHTGAGSGHRGADRRTGAAGRADRKPAYCQRFRHGPGGAGGPGDRCAVPDHRCPGRAPVDRALLPCRALRCGCCGRRASTRCPWT